MTKVLITGGTGFLGSYVKRILSTGHEVITTSRSREYPCNASLNESIRYMDLLDQDSIRHAMQGCDIVIHLAAKVSFNPIDDLEVWQVNYEGTNNLLEIAQELKIRKFIHFSTALTLGMSDDPTSIHINDRKPTPDCAYAQSKRAAEQAVRRSGLNYAIIYPTTCRPEIYLNHIHALPLVAYPTGGTNIVDPLEVALTVRLILNKNLRGEHVVAGHNITFKDLFRITMDRIGMHKPMIKLPKVSTYFCPMFFNNGSPVKTPFVYRSLFQFKYYTRSIAVALHIKTLPLYKTIERGIERYGEALTKGQSVSH